MQPGEGEYYEEIVHNEFAYISIGGMSGPYVGRFQQGDIIAVKESWMNAPNYPLLPEKYYYKASAAKQFLEESPNEWHSPVTMPREAHRLFLGVVSVKVERLQDISEGDVIAEGIEEFTKDNTIYKYGIDGWDWSTMPRTPKEAYQRLYNIHPDKWQRNEWVFVYEFRRVDIKQEDQP